MTATSVATPDTDEKIMVASSLEIRPMLATFDDEGHLMQGKVFTGYLTTFLTRVESMLTSNLATVSFDRGYVSEVDGAMFIYTDVKIAAEPSSDLDVALLAWEGCPLEDEAGYIERKSRDVDTDLHRAVEAHLTEAAHREGFTFRFSASSAQRA